MFNSIITFFFVFFLGFQILKKFFFFICQCFVLFFFLSISWPF